MIHTGIAVGLLRLRQIIGDPDADPPVPALIPVSRATWYAGIRSGIFPAPIRIGRRISAWRATQIQALIDHQVER
jgi:prophage regulatory protein